jgi:hemolysin D
MRTRAWIVTGGRRRLAVVGVVLLIATLVAASFVVRVESVTFASGKLVVTERTQEIVAPYAAAVLGVGPRNGQRIAKGDVLLTLDVSVHAADVVRLADALKQNEVTSARLSAFGAYVRETAASEEAVPLGPVVADPLLQAMTSLLHAQLAANAGQRQEAEIVAAGLDRRVRALGKIRERHQELLTQVTSLQSEGFYSQSAVLRALNEAEEKNVASDDARSELRRSRTAILRAREERSRILAAAMSSTLKELEDLAAARETLRKSIEAAEFRAAQGVVRSPVDGTVEDLRITTVPTTVAAGQALVRVVPTSGALFVEGRISDKDMGFVHARQPCRVKLDSFPYVRYGTLGCTVVAIARDRESPERGEFLFRAEIRSDKRPGAMADAATHLRPGMGATIDIVTGKRSLASFFLEPVFQGFHDAFSER